MPSCFVPAQSCGPLSPSRLLLRRSNPSRPPPPSLRSTIVDPKLGPRFALRRRNSRRSWQRAAWPIRLAQPLSSAFKTHFGVGPVSARPDTPERQERRVRRGHWPPSRIAAGNWAALGTVRDEGEAEQLGHVPASSYRSIRRDTCAVHCVFWYHDRWSLVRSI